MSTIGPKPAPLRLDSVSYETLRQQVLRRDGWRCQSCGTMSNLEVHHTEFRSHVGEDSELNLITLCAKCHARAHGTWKSDDSIAGRPPVQPDWYRPAATGSLNIRPSRHGNILPCPSPTQALPHKLSSSKFFASSFLVEISMWMRLHRKWMASS